MQIRADDEPEPASVSLDEEEARAIEIRSNRQLVAYESRDGHWYVTVNHGAD